MAESIFTHSNLFAQQVNPAYPMKRGGGFQCYVGGIPFVTLFYPMALTNIHLYIYIYGPSQLFVLSQRHARPRRVSCHR